MKLRAVPAILVAALALAACGQSGGDQGSTPVTFSYSNAVLQVEKVPLHQALAKLHGKESFHQSGDDAVQAVARGESDFGTANASTVFAATKKGVPIKAVMTAFRPAYLLVAPTSVADPGGLDGKRVGIQSKISSTTLYTDLALAGFRSAKPRTLVIPSSANRVQALIAGQLDASVVQYGDWLTLQQKAPGKYHVIYDVAAKNPAIIDSVIFTATRTVQSDPGKVNIFLAAVRAQYAATYTDKAGLATAIATAVPKTSKAAAGTLADEFTADRIWPPDGGFGSGTIDATLGALRDAGLLDASTLPTATQCCTAQFLQAAGK